MIPAITKSYGIGAKMPKKIIEYNEIVKAKCLKCGKIRSISFEKKENFRQLYCKECGEVVIWERIKCSKCPLEDDPGCENYFCGGKSD